MADPSPPSNPEPPQGLPPVTPPSGRHIVQMFVVPGVMVALVVFLFLGCSGFFSNFFGWLIGYSSSPKQLLSKLQDPNFDIRWRAANDLAQVLKRDDELATDPELSLKLTDLLEQALDEFERKGKSLGDKSIKRSEEEQKAEWIEFKKKREYIRFLSACLGTLKVPTGAPLLIRMARKDEGHDPKTAAVLRRHAVWMLANLGDNLKRYQSLPQDRQDAILARFQEAEQGSGKRGELARYTADYLQGKGELGVIDALAECAKSDDPDLRKYAAFAFTFWEGSQRENEVADRALVQLAEDGRPLVRTVLGEED